MVSLIDTLCQLSHLNSLELIVTGYPDFSSKDNNPLDIDLFSHLDKLNQNIRRISLSYDSKFDEKSINSIVRVLPKLTKLEILELNLERMFISNSTVNLLERAFSQEHRFATLRLRFAALNLTISVDGMIEAMMKSMRSDDMLIKICFINNSEFG